MGYNGKVITLANLFLHLDQNLIRLVGEYGAWVYGITFLVLFCETGLVVTPFLPGDSLLFALGTVAGTGSLSMALLIPLLSAAAILGDSVNYAMGKTVGSRFAIPAKHLEKTKRFYERYGNLTILLARFAPFVRTFAPFLAGVGRMRYPVFLLYNIIGGVLWVTLFLLGGYFLGNLPAVREHFTLVIVGIIVVFSVGPALLARRK